MDKLKAPLLPLCVDGFHEIQRSVLFNHNDSNFVFTFENLFWIVVLLRDGTTIALLEKCW